MVAYSETTDLLTGAIPTPSYLDLTKVVQDAADEIDSKLGHIYETPFNMNELGPLTRPARLLLKRLNNFLATGRLILAVASPEENQQLHAYGWSLIHEVNTALNSILAGDITLTGAPLLTTDEANFNSGPQINNLDSESSVEAFYNRIANPDYVYPVFGVPYQSPDTLVNE